MCKKCKNLLCCFVQCLSASTILSSHGMSQEVGMTFSDFSFLCPALLNQIDGSACILHGDAAGHGERGRSPLKGQAFIDDERHDIPSKAEPKLFVTPWWLAAL